MSEVPEQLTTEAAEGEARPVSSTTEAAEGEARPLGESARAVLSAVLSRGAVPSAIAEPFGRSAAMGAEADARAVLGARRPPALAVSSSICAWPADETADGPASLCARPHDAPYRAPFEEPPGGAPAELPLTKPLGWPPGARSGGDAPY
jgi:hypothetical protein